MFSALIVYILLMFSLMDGYEYNAYLFRSCQKNEQKSLLMWAWIFMFAHCIRNLLIPSLNSIVGIIKTMLCFMLFSRQKRDLRQNRKEHFTNFSWLSLLWNVFSWVVNHKTNNRNNIHKKYYKILGFLL